MTTEFEGKIIAVEGCPEPLCPGSMNISHKQCYVDGILSTPADQHKFGNILVIADGRAHQGCPQLQECIVKNTENIKGAREIQAQVRAEIEALAREPGKKPRAKYGKRSDKGKAHKKRN